MKLTSDQRQARQERNDRIVEDYKKGMEIVDILIKYKLEAINHILDKYDLKRGRYRNLNGMCKNHPDRKAASGTLCEECKKNYLKDWHKRHKAKTPVKETFKIELTPNELKIRDKYRNMEKHIEVGYATYLESILYDSRKPSTKQNFSGYIWR